ncbi:MAG: peptide ABC transporter substrate-binding protein [Chloroflexi bacterium]|nr:peptide ABC transporter substrate-binding protein [Chloroflexota bacterium]
MKESGRWCWIVSALMLAACAAPPPVSVETVERVVEKVVTATPPRKVTAPKSLTICMGAEPETLLPGGTTRLAAAHVLEALMDGPMDNRDYDYQPVILEKLPNVKDGDAKVAKVKVNRGEAMVNADGEVVKAERDLELDQVSATFKLKAGLKWEDGAPLNAADAVFGYTLLKDKNSGIVNRYLFDRTASYTATNELSVMWTGMPGFFYPDYNSAFFMPLPVHLLKNVASADLKTNEYARKPLAYGAFKMKEWIAGDHIELEKNPNYFRAAEGLPKVDRLIFRFIPDVNDALTQGIAGDCDVITQDALGVEQVAFIERADSRNLLRGYFTASPVWEHLDFNVTPEKAARPRPTFFNDVRVRQAVAYALNRKEIADRVVFGKVPLLDTLIARAHWAFAAAGALEPYAYDPKKAEALLDQAGWVKGADGIRAKAGQRFAIAFTGLANNKPVETIAQVFRDNLRAVGIEVRFDYVLASALFARGREDTYLSGQSFDVIQFAWRNDTQVPVNLYRCDQAPSRANGFIGQNNTGYCNAEYDVAATGYFNNLDRDSRIKFAQTALKILNRDVPFLPLYPRLKVSASNPRVLNLKPNATHNSELWNVEEWDVKE